MSTEFLLIPLSALLLSSIAAGIAGSYVVTRRISFIAGGLSHSVIGGIGIATYIEYFYPSIAISPIYVALITGIILAWISSYLHLVYLQNEDILSSLLWSMGMAIGLLFMSQIPYSQEILDVLVGHVLWTSMGDLIFLFGLDILIIITVTYFWYPFLWITFDQFQAKVRGIPTEKIYTILLMLISVAVVMLVYTVGSMLTITMLTIPTATALLYATSFLECMTYSIIFSSFTSTIGFMIAYLNNTGVGATVALTSGITYLLLLLFNHHFHDR